MATFYDQSFAPLKYDDGGTLLSRIAATATSWGRLGHWCDVATLRLCGISPSSAFRLFAFALPAARRLWRGIRRALLVYTTTSPEPVISDAFAADTNRGSNAEPRWVSPIEVASGHPRNYALENFKVMLCDCSCVLPESLRAHDLTPTRLKGINLGHDPRRSKYLVYIPAVRRIISTADVIFDEFSFTTLGGAWQPFKIRGAVEQERPQVPEAIVRAEPPHRPARRASCARSSRRPAALSSDRRARLTKLYYPIDIQSTAPIVYYLEPGRRKVTCHVH